MALGCASALERDGGVFEIADCGAGKTSVAIGTVVAHAGARDRYRVVVMCPGHIVGSWIQELDDVLGVKATEVSSWRGALSVSYKPAGVEWLIVGRDRAKLGPLRTRATWLVGERELCPDCGKEAGGKDLCLHCGAQMWQYTTPRRWPIAKILGKKQIDYFIGDECVVAGTKIATPCGCVAVEEIVPGDMVLSLSCGVVVQRRVSRVIKSRRHEPLVEISSRHGRLLCTAGHKIFTSSGEQKPAGSLTSQECVYVLRAMREENSKNEAVPEPIQEVLQLELQVKGNVGEPCIQGANGVQEAREISVSSSQAVAADMRSLQSGFQEYAQAGPLLAGVLEGGRKAFAGDGAARGQAPVPVVRTLDERPQQILLSFVSHEGIVERSVLALYDVQEGISEVAEAEGCRFGENEAHEQGPKDQGKIKEDTDWARVPKSRRKWKWANASAAIAVLSAGKWLEYGVSDSNWSEGVDCSRCGHSTSGSNDCSGGGRGKPQDQETEKQRQAQDENAFAPRVDRSAILELRNRIECKLGGEEVPANGGCSQHDWVYDLEVEDTHCYFANGILVSNCHELATNSAQANASGRFIARARYKILLTATPTGGKAEDLRPTLFRMFPNEMVRRGYAWEDKQKFSERYGRIEIDSRGKRKKKSVVPGIMPDLFADFMLPHAGFLRLEDISDNLPSYSEETMSIKMGPDLDRCYSDLEAALKLELSALLKNGKMQLLGPMLAALLCYPDAPSNWGNVGYMVGGVRVPVYKPESHVGLTTKDKAIINLCKSEKKLGRQVWLYIQNKRVGRRLFSLLAAEGLNTKWLTTKDAKPRQRREWISQNAPGLDVMISHAKLVQTGIDLFDKKKWRFNFPTLVFAQCGMIPSELRQAAGRARRIGQVKPCRTVFMTYAGTVQQKLHQLMLRKLAAAEVLEGKLLQSYSCDDSLTEELARALCGH